MTVLLVGGGTGGHIVPLLPIAAKLKECNSKISVIAVTDKGGKFNEALDKSKDIDKVFRISGGKYRRYPNQPKLQSIFDLKKHALNARDSVRTVKGLSQARKLIKQTNASAIFIKGGYVSVPVGIAAKMAKVPFITHDSDAVPSLSTKIIGRNAVRRLSGMPITGSNQQNLVHVGVPVSDEFKKVSEKEQNQLKKDLNIPKNTKMVLVTGGSQGAHRINVAVEKILPELKGGGVFTVHQTGKDYHAHSSELYKPISYIDKMYSYSGAADVIVSRAGSSLAEFAQQSKPIIVIPAKHLAGGHQMLNSKILKKRKAAIVLDEDELEDSPQLLADTVGELLKDKTKSAELASAIKEVYPGDSADKIAKMLIDLTE